jgi:transposase
MCLVSDVPAGSPVEAALREEVVRLREAVAVREAQLAAGEAENAELRAQVARLELLVAELMRRLGMDSSDSGTPSSKEPIGARERRRAERRKRDEGLSSRERSAERRRGGQPGHEGSGLRRDPDPQEVVPVQAPAECSGCGSALAGGVDAGAGWAQVWDIQIRRHRVEYRLPRVRCVCCGRVTAAQPPQGQAGTVSYGPVLNAAAVLLGNYANVPTERAAHVIGMLFGQNVSAGFVDRAAQRLAERLDAAGFEEAMQAALLAEAVLGADESPVNVLRSDTDPATGAPVPGSAQVMAVRSLGERLVWLRPLVSRAAVSVLAALKGFTGYLVVDGYSCYQQLLATAKGIQQCVQHVIRRCRQVAKLGPGSLQSWTGEVTAALREAHDAVQAAKVAGQKQIDPELLTALRARYDKAVAFGQAHNRHRDWHDGNHPGYTLAGWLADHADQVWLYATVFDVEWTNNGSERAIKDPKRHQAVSGYWHTQQTLGRYCKIRSYLVSAHNHGVQAIDAIHTALAGNPWLPPTAAA